MKTQWFYDSSVQRFHGLSTDTKPTGCTNGSVFIEINTGTIYLYNAAAGAWVAVPNPSNYTNLTNKPSINGVTLVGDKSFSDLGLVSPMVLKGRVDDVDDLPDEAEAGWVYLVGIAGSDELEEYVYTDDGEWEFLGYNMLVVDSELSNVSENPVQNKVITAALALKADLSILTPISESAYEALQTYTNPLYFIYEDTV